MDGKLQVRRRLDLDSNRIDVVVVARQCARCFDVQQVRIRMNAWELPTGNWQTAFIGFAGDKRRFIGSYPTRYVPARCVVHWDRPAKLPSGQDDGSEDHGVLQERVPAKAV